MTAALGRWLGVDVRVHRVLVRAFWDLSMRSTSAWRPQRGRREGGSVRTAWWMFAVYGLLLGGSAAASRPPREVFGLMVGSTAFVLVGISVVADFAVTVIAPGEDEILFHLPMTSRTYLAARLTVAAFHVAILAACFAAPAALAGSIAYESVAYGPLLLVAQVVTAWFTLVVAFLVYRLGLRWLGSERFKDVLVYLPAGISVFLYLGPQLLTRSAGLRGALPDATNPWLLALPPSWFAALPEVLLGRREPHVLAAAALGVVALPLGAWWLVRRLGGGLLEDLLRLSTSRGVADGAARAPSIRSLPPKPLVRRLLAVERPEARAGYLLTLGALRSRDSRARVFGVVAIPLVMMMVSVLRPGTMFSPTVAVYVLGMGGASIVALMPFHEHHAAGWIYEALPLRHYGSFVLGAVRAVVLHYLVPPFVVVFAVLVARGLTVPQAFGAFHALFAAMLTLPLTLAFVHDPPFARGFGAGETSLGVGFAFLEMFFLGALGLVHWGLAWLSEWAFVVSAPLVLLLLVLWLRGQGRRLDTTWVGRRPA